MLSMSLNVFNLINTFETAVLNYGISGKPVSWLPVKVFTLSTIRTCNFQENNRTFGNIYQASAHLFWTRHLTFSI